MVFIHPNPTDHHVWAHQMAHFSTWCRAVGIDLPGYGRSPRALPGLSMADIATACWLAVDDVAPEPAILVGCSVGHTTALHMAHQQPERVAGIILSGCGYHPDGKSFASKRIAQYEELGVANRRRHFLEGLSTRFAGSPLAHYFADLLVERNDTADVASIVETFRAVGRPDPEEIYDGITAPVLIITGSEDHAHSSAFDLQRRIPGTELQTIPGAGHECFLEQPWLWDEYALEFLRRHRLL
jgi:pimeloyl-ACP methyl ester carboxylesterase